MKDGILEIVGKKIKGVVVYGKEYKDDHQVFLIFDDNSFYEMYSECNISGMKTTLPGNQRSGSHGPVSKAEL